VVEGLWHEVQKLLDELHALLVATCPEDFILNVQYHIHPKRDVVAEMKTASFKPGRFGW
jgi:hypothetical protein